MTTVTPPAAIPALATAVSCKLAEPLAALPFQQMLQAEAVLPAVPEADVAADAALDLPDAIAIDWAGLVQSFSTVAAPPDASTPPAATDPATTTPDAVAVPLALPEPSLRWLDVLKETKHSLPSRPSPEPTAVAAGLPVTAQLPTQGLLDAQIAAQPPGIFAHEAAPSPPPPAALAMPPAPLVSNSVMTSSPVVAAPTLVMDSPDWPQQLGEQIQWRLGAGIQEARIEISPRELGAVEVRLSVDDKGLSVHLTAAHAQTRELLQSELPRLREALQQGGVLLAEAQVGRESPGREAPRQTTPHATRGTRGEDADTEPLSTRANGWHRRNGLLDDYA